MVESKPIKVCLTNKGEDTETPWAQDLGPAPASAPVGSRIVKLVNVPFMHAKPTWGDTIVVSPTGNEQPLTWDRSGTPWKQISTRIVEDGGRWAMIVDYAPHAGADVQDAFQALTRACEGQRVVCEGAWAPREGEPGRAYFAVPKEVSAEKLMDILRAASLPLDLIQIHPEPKKREPAPATGNGAAKKIKAGAIPVEKLAEPAPADEAPTSRAPKATGKAAAAKAAPAKAAPTKAAPAKAAPTTKAPSRAAAAPAKAAPAKAAPSKAAPSKAAPTTKAPSRAAASPSKAAAAKAAPAKAAAKSLPAKKPTKASSASGSAKKPAAKTPAAKKPAGKKPGKK
ncbi:MAG TPA: hypothetical protein VM513_29405 [Kofleriaceae bacterium]|nr:hypothetical protein [Kofleriaceae bacterium]